MPKDSFTPGFRFFEEGEEKRKKEKEKRKKKDRKKTVKIKQTKQAMACGSRGYRVGLAGPARELQNKVCRKDQIQAYSAQTNPVLLLLLLQLLLHGQ